MLGKKAIRGTETTKPTGLLTLAEPKLRSLKDKILDGRQNRWTMDFVRAGNPVQRTKINKRTAEMSQMSTFDVVWWVVWKRQPLFFTEIDKAHPFWGGNEVI